MRYRGYGFSISVVALAGLLVTTAPSRAMEIARFEAMSARDQSRYLVVLLEGSRKLLESQGKRDMANKIISEFDTKDPGETVPKGMRRFSEDLMTAEELQIETGRALHVAHALLLTYKKLGVEVPKREFMHLGDGFKPADPPKTK